MHSLKQKNHHENIYLIAIVVEIIEVKISLDFLCLIFKVIIKVFFFSLFAFPLNSHFLYELLIFLLLNCLMHASSRKILILRNKETSDEDDVAQVFGLK